MASLADLLRHVKETGETLSTGYPRAKGFANALMANVERNVPTTQELQNPAYMQQRALNYMSPMAGAIKAYHGTPHEFDRFDMSKIGTGEGAQAYGHGLYFAQNPKIAEFYSDAGIKYSPALQSVLDSHNGDINKARLGLIQAVKNGDTKWAQFLDELNEVQPNIYETSIQWPDAAREAADPLSEHHLLDLDKSFHHQSDFVKQKLLDLNDPYVTKAIHESPKFNENGDYWDYMGNTYESKTEALEDVTPQDLITGGRGNFKNPAELSKLLNQVGIPGSKYLDQGSRTGGGTSNYVMFGDEYPQIVNRAGSLAQLLRK